MVKFVKKTLRILLSDAMALSLAVCSSKTDAPAGAAEYEGTAQGFHASVTVKVTVDNANNLLIFISRTFPNEGDRLPAKSNLERQKSNKNNKKRKVQFLP